LFMYIFDNFVENGGSIYAVKAFKISLGGC